MDISGSVSISIPDFDELRKKAMLFDELKKQLQACTHFTPKEIAEDEWIQVISIDAEKVTQVAARYSLVEEVYEDDVIQLVNVESVVISD